ncbi:MAG: bifunctional phosphopantothenoylcysteine decarboxylase/phosphopantothenate--cysteine ligase CoaBC [Bryobacterales bacterium]|nr:bifunctional phosphopantothenoylcysteine decarboxylase/phosphopantothenate--cysteine ligase CoaBC [Bryobacteraceae bacterium]MDW8355735.1 bifunctional phosphopantothenoylcysteine decarboxylase/phosphopantothenate--cysteine ligase CoaBC [Bryobacterales bacterium]
MRVALGVGGGIAAYKAAELARLLAERGAAVEVIMTAAAQQFVRPLTFAALTGRRVITALFPNEEADALTAAIEHIRVAQENDLLLVAPATADLMAKFARGIADDFLTTLYLAFRGPVLLAPAMNVNMWHHPATQENLGVLRARGHRIIGPGEGTLACGMAGPGRMAEPEEIAEIVFAALSRRRDLEGETVLVTAGPTREALDPVRYLSNRSSGKMGYALAQAALERGAEVILISGPVHLAPPAGAKVVRVETAVEMRRAVLEHLEPATIIVKAAAVADYHVARVPSHKLKKTAARISLELEPTPDILAELGQKKGDRLLIGFAAETENLREEARRKLASKNCDMIVANLVGPEGAAFESDDNEVVLALATGEFIEVPRASKREIADRIFDEALKLRLALHASR